MSLFIEFYLDEDVSTLVADLLRGRGFSAISTVEAGQLGNTDVAQLNYAVTNSKVLRPTIERTLKCSLVTTTNRDAHIAASS